MIKAYQEIFQVPGSLAFSAAAFIGRMPMSMAGLGIITMLYQLHGSYALAGTITAVFSLSVAILGPQVSRLVDRFGQRKVLPFTALISAGTMLALLLAARADMPAGVWFVCAAVAGCMPSMSAMVRARWTSLLADKTRLQTAYALESVLDEVSFIIGPPLSIGLSVSWFPEAGLLTALLLQLIGVAAFVLQRRTEPPIREVVGGREKSPLKLASMQILLVLLFCMGTIVGTIDVVSIAFAAERGQPAAASMVLSAYALGSCIAGLAFGALRIELSLPGLLYRCATLTALATLPLLFINSIAGLALTMFVGGLFFAPTMIVAMSLVEATVAGEKITEGFTWLISALGAGMAAGAALSGLVVDWQGARIGFGVALMAGALGLGMLSLGLTKLKLAVSKV